MYIAISVIFVHCCLLVSSLHGLNLLTKTAKKHQHSLHGVALLHSDCEPEPEPVFSTVELEVVLA